MNNQQSENAAINFVYQNFIKLFKKLGLCTGTCLNVFTTENIFGNCIAYDNVKLECVNIYIPFKTTDSSNDACTINTFESYARNALEGKLPSAILIFNTLEYQTENKALMDSVHNFSVKYNIPVIVGTMNVCHIDIALKMLEGRIDFIDHNNSESMVSPFNSARFSKVIEESGFKTIENCDLVVEKSQQHFPADDIMLASGSLVHQYLENLKSKVDPYAYVTHFIRAYCPVKCTPMSCEESETDVPFLSIITRTQGKRIAELSEVFLCLTGQSCTDFEVILVEHKVSERKSEEIDRVVDELPEWMQTKIRKIKVPDGNRTKPLNVGFENARGQYVSILDDDDIVFDNWVESFYELAQKKYGSVLHAFSVSQKWNVLNKNDLYSSVEAVSPFNVQHCKSFNLFQQFLTNNCPTMSYALPRSVFSSIGLRFDEKLTTIEDWDFLMQCVFICGVSDTQSVTSIYRLWQNAENSQLLHSHHEWEINTNHLKDKLYSSHIILPRDYIEKTVEKFPITDPEISEPDEIVVIYPDSGEGYSQETSSIAKKDKDNNQYWFCNNISEKAIVSLRIDPCESGTSTISDLLIELTDKDGNSTMYNCDTVNSNGYKFNNSIVFLKSDPQIYLDFNDLYNIDTVKIHFIRSRKVEDKYIDDILTSIRDEVLASISEENATETGEQDTQEVCEDMSTNLNAEAPVQRRSLIYRVLRRAYHILKR